MPFKNLITDDAEEVVVSLPYVRKKILAGVDFRPVDYRISQPDLDSALGRQLQVHGANIGEEVHVAQRGRARNPSGGFGPYAPKLGERHVFACDVPVRGRAVVFLTIGRGRPCEVSKHRVYRFSVFFLPRHTSHSAKFVSRPYG